MSAYVCKVLVFESARKRQPKSVKCVNADARKINAVKKCLFGVADPEDTMELLREQMEMERCRFEERFGFPLEEIERIEKENVNNDERTQRVYCESLLTRSLGSNGRKRKNDKVQPLLTGTFQKFYCIEISWN